MQINCKRLLSFVVALVLVLGMVPFNALEVFAADSSTVTTEQELNDSLVEDITVDVEVPDGKLARIGETWYATLAEALKAAMTVTGDVTVEIYGKVTLNSALSGSFDSIKFVGKAEDAEIYLDVQGYITATGKKVAFEDLILSKAEGGFITNAGFMNVAFGIYDVAEVTYTDCTFANGAYAGSGKVTYTGCTFKKSWDKYGLWAYGDVETVVDDCTFADYRGIKMYAEGAAKTVDLTVKDTDFSAVTDKPAIVLTYGQSVTLEGNTYSSTGVFELDLDGAPNGTAVTSDVAPTCVNDNGACGVLVDGKIYTTVAQAAEVATEGSTVTLLHDSTETVEFAEGVTLDKNGHTADGATVKVSVPAGNDFTGYTRGDAIWGEVWGNATESFVIKVLDANDNVMGTTSLNNIDGIIDGDLSVTWSLKLDAESNTDAYWTMSWTTAPTVENQPAKVELWVDGVKVSGGNVVLNAPDDLNKIYAAVTGENGKILSYYTDVQEAIKAAAPAGTVELLRDVTVDKWIMISQRLSISSGQIITIDEINGLTIDGNGHALTVKSIESATNGNRLFYDADKLNIKDLTINYTDAAANQGGIALTSGTIENVTFNGGVGVLPGTGDITITGCTFNTNGSAIYNEEERDNLVVDGNTFNTAAGQYAIYLRGNTTFTDNTVVTGKVNVTNSATGTISGNNFGTERFKVYNGAKATISNNTINNLVFNDDTVANSTFTGNTLSESAQAALKAVSPKVAQIGDTTYTSLQEAFKAATSGCTIEILSDVTVSEKWDCRDYATNGSHSQFKESVTINGNGHTIKFTGTINDSNWNTVFRFEEDATVNNLIVDISEATGAQRVITAKKSLSVDGLTIIGSAKYGIIFGEGASATDLAATEIVIKNSTLTGTRRAISDNEGGKDVKSVVITGNTLNANVYVSASESIQFSNNTAASEVDLRSYAAENVLSVEAQGNTLNTSVKNYIYAKTINAQAEFTTVRPAFKVATKAELDAALAAAVAGDTILLTADIDYGTTQLAIAKAITLDLGGKTLTTRNAYGGMSVKGDPTIKNGTIVHASNTAAIKVWNATAFEDLVIDVQGKGDANKTIGGIVLQSGTTTRVGSIKNVTIQGAALTNGIETYNCGDAAENVIGSMENVTIDAQGTGMLISAPCGTATNCSISGGTNGIEIWIKGNYSASLDLVDSDVEGGVFAHDEFSSNPDIVNNGSLSLTVDGATTGADAADITLTLARAEKNVAGILEDIVEAAEAKVNDTYYATLTEAMAAAKAGDTVTIFEGTYAVPSMKAGITVVGEVTAEGEPAVLLEGTLSGTLEDLTLKNLHIKGANAQRWAYAKGDLVFENVTFEATSVYALHFDGITEGTNLTYQDCTIIGWAAMGGSPASCTFDGCTIKDNGTYGVIRTYFPTTIKDCTFDVDGANPDDVYQDGIHAVGTTIMVENSTNDNGDIKDVLNISGASKIYVDGVLVLAPVVATIEKAEYFTLQDAENAAKDGDIIVLADDIVLDSMVTFFNSASERMVTLDMNGKTITLSDKWNNAKDMSAFWVCDGLTVTGNGTIEAAPAGDPFAYAFIVGHRTQNTTNGYSGKLVIENGTFSSDGSSVVSVTNGTATILGGSFTSAGPNDDGKYMTLNCIDDMHAAGKASIVVKGGTFANFNPENNGAEGAGTNFCADGYIAETTDEGATYTVRELKHLVIVVSPVATMSTTTITVATMDEAVAYAQANPADSVTYQITGPVELTTGFSHGILDLGTNVTIEGVTDEAKLTIVGGGVPDIKGVTFKNITIADEGTYLPTANEFMYQNFIDCTFENVTFEDGIRLSGTSTITDCTVNANTTNEYAIWLDEGDFTMTGTKVTAGNDAYGLIKSDTVDTITITGNTFKYLGEANKEALNTNGAIIIATDNTFIDCTEGIIPADKTNYAADGTTVLTEADVTSGNTVKTSVAKIGDVKYETLTAAAAAATAGDTITFLTDITEDARVGKSITIDGAGYQYTGNIQVKGGSAEATIKNVNFVGGTAYAVKTDSIRSITIENCTVSGYNTYGFLYANNSTPTITVKNVTVDGGTCGINWNYGTTATLENVVISNVEYGINTRNSSTKTVTIKNCKINATVPLRINEQGTANQIFVFKGLNEIATLPTSQYAVVQGAQCGQYVGDIQPVVEKAQTGDTVKLLSDIALTEADRAVNADRNVLIDVAGKDITLDMNGKKISVVHEDAFTNDYIVAVIRVADGAGLTVTGNGTIDVKVLAENADMAYMFWKRGTTGHLTVENGTFHMNDSADSMVYTNGNEIVNIKGGTWTLDAYGTRGNREPWIFNVQGAGDNHVVVTGGTFNADINRQYWSNEVLVPETYYTVDNGNGTWTVQEGAVAYVNEGMLTGPYFVRKNIGYATLEEAIAAADTDETVTLLTDVTLSDVATIEKAITLDLGGYTLTGADGAIVLNVKADTTITNGTILGNKSGTSSGLIDIYANLIMNDVNVETSKINALRFKAGNCTAVLNNCNITGAFKGYGGSVWQISSGTYKASSTAISDQLNGSASIAGGTFYYAIAEEDCAPGYVVVDNGDGTWTVKYAPACFVDADNDGILDEGEAVYGNLDQVFAKHTEGDVYVVLTGNIVANGQVDTDADAHYYFTTNVAEGVTMDFLFADDWNYIQKMNLGENITLNAPYLLAWTDLDIYGTVNTGYAYFTVADVTVHEGGVLDVTTGDATVQVKNGANLTVNGTVNTHTINVWVGESKLTVSGQNAQVNASWIDIWDGAPSVAVENGATLKVDEIKVSRGGAITIDGATLETDNLEVGHNGESAGTVTVINNGSITNAVLIAVGSTISGPAGMNVTSGVDGYVVSYMDGVYKLGVPVAQVGNAKYASIDEAIAAWKNKTTLTLLADVTLSDVITLSSQEHHYLELGTYTMTAASGKDAIEIKSYGRGNRSESGALTITADATNPGGINAGTKACITYKYDSTLANNQYDRPIIYIKGGVFNGASYGGIKATGHNSAQDKCATFNISGGTFNCGLNLTKTKLVISGGTFHGSVNCTGGSTSTRLISGGTFKSFGFMTADAANKFSIGTAMGNYNVGVYVNDDGYLVVGGPVITEPGEQFAASSTNYSGWHSYLQYSSAKANELYYTSLAEAMADNNKATGKVTVYVDTTDMTGVSYKGTLLMHKDLEDLTVTFAEDTTPTWTVDTEIDGKVVVYTDSVADGVVTRVYRAITPVAQIGENYYDSFEEALNTVQDGETITLLNVAGSENKEIEFTKDISFTITGTAPNYALPTITFQNATVTIKDAEILIPELDARQNATIHVVDSIVHDAGGDSIVKSYFNGAINISGTSVVHTMQVTTMGYITISDTAKLNATWQTNVYGNGMIVVEDDATFATAALQLVGKEYSGRDNTDADRVGKPATIVVDGANLIVGKVLSDNGADYSYNSSKGINIGTIDGKTAVLDIKNGAKVNIYMANGETANIGAAGTVNVDASSLILSCRSENGTAALVNNGTVNVSGASDIAASKVTGSGWVYMKGVTLDADTKLLGAKVRFASGTNNIDGSVINDGFFQVGIGAYNGVDANVDTVNGVVVNVKNAVIGANGSTYAGWIGSGYYDTDEEKAAAMTDAKYVLNIEDSIAEFGYLHISNDGEMNVKGNAAEKAWYNNSDYSFYAGEIIVNGTATFDATDVLALYTKVSCDNGTDKPGTINIVNGTEYEAERHNGAIAGNCVVLYKTGVMNVNAAELYIGDLTSIAADAVLNIGANATAMGVITNDGTINLTDVNATLTTPETQNVTTTLAGYAATYVNGVYKLEQMAAQNTKTQKCYMDLSEALAEAKSGETVQLLKDITTDQMILVMEGVTLDLNGKTLTTSNYLLAIFKDSYVIDSSLTKEGMLKIDASKMKLLSTNSMLPVRVGEDTTTNETTVKFAQITLHQEWYAEANQFRFWLATTDTLLPSLYGGDDVGKTSKDLNIKFQIEAKWNGGSQVFEFDEDDVDNYMAAWDSWAMTLSVTNTMGVQDLQYRARVVYGTETGNQVFIQLGDYINHGGNN